MWHQFSVSTLSIHLKLGSRQRNSMQIGSALRSANPPASWWYSRSGPTGGGWTADIVSFWLHRKCCRNPLLISHRIYDRDIARMSQSGPEKISWAHRFDYPVHPTDSSGYPQANAPAALASKNLYQVSIHSHRYPSWDELLSTNLPRYALWRMNQKVYLHYKPLWRNRGISMHWE